jgi:hypothetical protein
VDQLFDVIEWMLDREIHDLTVDYDPVLGFPTQVIVLWQDSRRGFTEWRIGGLVAQ